MNLWRNSSVHPGWPSPVGPLRVAAVLLEFADTLKIDREEVADAFTDSATKARIKAEIDLAEARGVFGSPFFIVEGEAFWGNDRLAQLERWLEKGPF